MTDRECLDDLEASARQILSVSAIKYISNSSDRGQTDTDNINAFRRIRLRPRLMRDVSRRDTSTTILGHKVSFPIAIAPTALHHWVHPGGERLTAKAAESMDTGMVLSMWSGSSLEDIAECSPSGLRWLHITPLSNRAIIKQIVYRAENNGYKGIFVTLDSPIKAKSGTPLIVSKLYRRTPVSYGHFKDTDVPLRTDHNLDIELIDNTITWEVIDWLRSITRLPIVGKGILTAEDAREAVKHGVSGILVSNHGGRQLDGVPATGENGVKRVLKILQEEFDIAMALTGCRSVEEINASVVRRDCTCAAKL
ncbi:2-Hydroxyacid oxidase 1-like isoform X2 [Amphiura filiformis]|uniref:2-Hydroxyacid oxidase 1-like isoform X2 n=1 Tax=Amphiura filiformis TaxID=82378 RepID=UPI003B20E9D8